MKSLTICYITARQKPEIDWFIDSFMQRQTARDIQYEPQFIFIDSHFPHKQTTIGNVTKTRPKPTVWQGEHRLTKVDWWAAANARNTGLCLCQTEWIAFLDDRCVLMDGWLQAIRDAMDGNYAVCGAYEKRHSMTVENGIIKHGGIITGEDTRADYMRQFRPGQTIMDCPGEWWFGCSNALPLEWALAVNGWPEECDGLSAEDCFFGMYLKKQGYPVKYNKTMKVVQDRTGSELGTPMKREDKGKSPNDKSHAQLYQLREASKSNSTIMKSPSGQIYPGSSRTFDIRALRNDVLAGKPFPVPTEPTCDWYDGQPIGEME